MAKCLMQKLDPTNERTKAWKKSQWVQKGPPGRSDADDKNAKEVCLALKT